MARNGHARAAIALGLGLVCSAGVRAQPVEGREATVQGEALRGQGRFLRGMAWYEVGAAQAQALEAESVFAWNRAVRSDYEQDLASKAQRSAARKALGREREEEAARRRVEMRRRWREHPTVADIRSGDALNALACDLADPAIPPTRWRTALVELPPEVTIEALAFRFADAPRARLPAPLAPSLVALDRMKGVKWPVALRRGDLGRERAEYRRAVAAVVETCVAGKPLSAPQVDAVRDALAALKGRTAEVVPAAGGLRKQAHDHLDRLDAATRIFLDRDFAEELVGDAERHRAKTVGELLGFMKKYRLLFAEADQDPEVWATYQTLYDLLKRQQVALNFADDPALGGNPAPTLGTAPSKDQK